MNEFLGSLRGPTLEGGAGIGPLTSPPSGEEVFPNVDFLELDQESDAESPIYRGLVLKEAVGIVARETGLSRQRLALRLGISSSGLSKWLNATPIGEYCAERALVALAKVRNGIPVVKN